MRDLYSELIIEEARNPQNQGEMLNADIESTHGNFSCGDQVGVSLRLSKDGKKIADVKWRGEGCAISQSAASITSEKIKGMSLAKAMKLGQADVESWMGLENVTHGREKCLMLGLQTIQLAISSKGKKSK